MSQFEIKKILVPLDFSETSMLAVNYAADLAQHAESEIFLIHVIENIHATTDPFFVLDPGIEKHESNLQAISMQTLNKVANQLKERGVKNVKTKSYTGRTHKEIVNAAKQLKADIIVMGTHGVSGFREFIMGSNTFSVVRDAKCPVLSVSKEYKSGSFNKILVPFTDIPHSREKLDYSIQLAKLFGAGIIVLGIDQENDAAHMKKITLETEQIKTIVEEYDVSCEAHVLQAPYHAKTILEFANRIKADVIVSVGDPTRQDISEYFTGSLSEQLINHSPIPVLSIHPSWNPEMVELWHGI